MKFLQEMIARKRGGHADTAEATVTDLAQSFDIPELSARSEAASPLPKTGTAETEETVVPYPAAGESGRPRTRPGFMAADDYDWDVSGIDLDDAHAEAALAAEDFAGDGALEAGADDDADDEGDFGADRGGTDAADRAPPEPMRLVSPEEAAEMGLDANGEPVDRDDAHAADETVDDATTEILERTQVSLREKGGFADADEDDLDPDDDDLAWDAGRDDDAADPERDDAVAASPPRKLWETEPDPDPEPEAATPAPAPDATAPTNGDDGPTKRRAGRVKTRLLGFNGQDAGLDPIAATGAAGAASEARFPVGWMVVTRGPGRGASFTLSSGASKIGRGEDQAVRLDFGDNSISRDGHAIIAYDEETRRFFIGHGGKANLVRLNDMPVLATEALSDGDTIRLGETTLLFVALCGETFTWKEDNGTDARHAAAY